MTVGVVSNRITTYLAEGGLFNPEVANAKEVRNLLIDAREEIEELRMVIKRYEPINTYNGLTIEQWKSIAETMRKEAFKTSAESDHLQQQVEILVGAIAVISSERTLR